MAGDPELACVRWRARVQRPDRALHAHAGFMRTLKEECIHVHHFRTLEEARFTITRFIQQYNSEWLLQRHGYKTPAEVRQQLTRKAA